MELNPYAKYLGDADPVSLLKPTVERLHALTSPLSAVQVSRPPAPGKWNVCEIVSHLADCELVFAFRLRQTLAEDHHIIQPFDQDRWGQRYAANQLETAQAALQALRNWNLRLLTTVTEEDRHRLATHPERGTMTFWTVVETMAGHDINHLQQIERLAANP